MRLSTCFTAVCLALAAVCTVSAQQSSSEFAVTIGALSGSNPNVPSGSLVLGSSPAFGINYARKFNDKKSWASLYWEINALGSPFRHLSGLPAAATSDVRSVFVTPGVRMQFRRRRGLRRGLTVALVTRFTIRAVPILPALLYGLPGTRIRMPWSLAAAWILWRARLM